MSSKNLRLVRIDKRHWMIEMDGHMASNCFDEKELVKLRDLIEDRIFADWLTPHNSPSAFRPRSRRSTQ